MVSILVINWKSPPLLRLSLTSLEEVISPQFPHEIIVVDVESGPETENLVCEEFAKVIYLPFKRNIGYTKAVNEGIKVSKGEYILILNPDVIPFRHSIEDLATYMIQHPEVGMAGPQLLNFDGSIQQTAFRFYTPAVILFRRTFLGALPFAKKVLDRFLMKDKDLSKPTAAGWLMGSALMVSRAASQKVGLMDESLFLYMSDVDWPRRFWLSGFKVIYYPLARMYHYHLRASKGKLGILEVLTNRFTRMHLKDAFRYFWKYGMLDPKLNI